MYILQVAPLTKLSSRSAGTLTYQYSEPLLIGTAVTIRIHTRNITGIVIICQEMTNDLKKDLLFEIKPIANVLSLHPILTERQLELAKCMSVYYTYPLGLLLKLFLPRISPVIKRYPKILSSKSEIISNNLSSKLNDSKVPRVFLGNSEERLLEYRRLIKKFPNSQILVICPNKQSLLFLKLKLEKFSPLIITSDYNTKQYREHWIKVKQGYSGIILSTRVGLFLPFSNLAWICLEDDTSENHSLQEMRPKYHNQAVAKHLSRIYNVPRSHLSILPSVDSLWELQQGNVSLLEDSLPKIKENNSIISMPNQYRLGDKGVLATPILDRIQQALEQNTPIIIHVHRRGESTYVMCDDCGHHLRDPYTGSLLVEHRIDTLSKRPNNYQESHILVSHKSNKWFKAVQECPKCHSSNLVRGGIGIERIAYFLNNHFQKASIDMLSADSSPDQSKQEEKVAAFERGEIQILISTSMIYKYLPRLKQVKFIFVIPSVDSLIGFPDYSTLEKAIHTLYLASQSAKEVLSQSFQDWDVEKDSRPPFIQRLYSQSPLKLLSEELELRKTYKFPPFYEIIAIETVHKYRDKALEQSKATKSSLRRLDIPALGPIETYRSRGNGQYVFTIIIQSLSNKSQKIKNKIYPALSNNQSINLNPSKLLS